jgi:adenine phosphoribosyltransferase
VQELLRFIRDIPDFPEPGIVFKDITPLLADPGAFRLAIDAMAATLDGSGADLVAGIEARGFVLAAPVAAALGVGFIPVRKAGKLPGETVGQEYALEYGTASVEVHRDALAASSKVAVLDDVLATGGTAEATCELLESLGGDVVAVSFLIELGFLRGRSKLEGRPVHTILSL